MININNKKIRLNKYISKSGLCSRRKADFLIKLGLISVNNNIIKELGYKVFINDIIKYNNKILFIKKNIYLIFNKPKNCITTLKDNRNRKTIFYYIPNIYKKYGIFPVGRLDKNTTGILLITNDGDLTLKLIHPKYKINKDYKVFLNKKLLYKDLLYIKNGVKLKEGKIKINFIKLIKKDKKKLIISINLGWNKILHRLFNKLGYKIINLIRINFAGFKLKDFNLKKGNYINLKKKKVYNIIKNNKNEK
ncbi:MAG: pseudouridine synthase [Candidatus Shikimatogenerans bostrichidophilus]|nr:MAG: pseudouridine synthase [Candidatus Shikimatogenerans bostrichidophilus]